jgi:hypothetical protein
MRAEIVVEQVTVGVKRECGGVVSHPALEAKRAGAGVDEHRRAGVTQRVKARPRKAGALGGRYEHAIAQVAWAQRCAVRATKEQLGLATAGDELAHPGRRARG